MKNIRKLMALVILIMASVMSLSACGNPYANMKLKVDDGGFENALVRRFEYAGEGSEQNKFEISASVTGTKKGVSTEVVFTIEDKGLIEEVDSLVEGVNTTKTFRLKDTGETYITVATKEGGLRERIKITSFANATGLEFTKTSSEYIPMLKGQTTDVSKVMPGFSKALLLFTPSYATERDVDLEVSDDNVKVDGNKVTVPQDFKNRTFRLTATLKSDTSKSVSATVRVLDPIDMNKIALKYVSTFEQRNYNPDDGKESPVAYELEKSSELGVDFNLYLADQQAGDEIRDAKNIFIDVDKNLSTEYSFTLNDSKGSHSKILASTNPRNSYSISNGDGVGNSDKYMFNINYSGYESIFTGVTVCVKVNINTFPTDVVINTNPNVTEVEEKESNIYVFNNYSGIAGTLVYPKLRNKGGFISGQTMYVSVFDLATNSDAATGAFTILDSKGNTVIPKITKVKSGEALYIRFDSVVLSNTDSYEGRYVLYAYASMDISITSLVTKTKEGNTTSDFNNLVLIKDYTLDATLKDETIELNSGDKEEVKLAINTADGKLPYDLFEVRVGAIAKLTLRTGSEQPAENGYFVESKDGTLGQTYYTVVAPNGYAITKNLFITKAYTESVTFSLKVGSLIIDANDKASITLDIQKTLNISLLVDGVEFTTLPPKYSIDLVRAGGSACTYEGWQRINSLSSPSQGSPDEFTFTLTYAGDASSSKVFTLLVTVVKPIKRITTSNSYVEILSNSIAPLTNKNIDPNITNTSTGAGGYLDISGKSQKTLYYTLNPLDASIGTMVYEGAEKDHNLTLLDLSIAEFSFIYNDNIVPLMQPYSRGNGGSYVEYEYNKYFFNITNNNGIQSIAWYNLGTNAPVTAADGSDLGYILSTTPITFEYGDISFKWMPGIVNNRIKLQLTDVTGGGTGDERFSIKLDYRQKYTVDPITYIVKGEPGNRYLTSDASSEVKINYVGSYKIEQSMFVEGDDGTVTGIILGGITYPVYDNSRFTYNRYYITVSTSTTFKIAEPVLTKTLTLVGQKDDTTVGQGVTGSGVYTINLNSNQITNGSTFGYSYLTSPLSAELEKPGLIVANENGGLTELVSGATVAISTLKYDGDQVVGATSNTSWTDATGLNFEINYLTSRIKFTIVNVAKFTNYIIGAFSQGESKILRIVTLDSAVSSNTISRSPIFVSLKISLKTGTASNPYLIYDAESLQNINLALTSYYEITNDISLQGANNWTPIGVGSDEATKFNGTITTTGNRKYSIYGFNGTISPAIMSEEQSTEFRYIGIFGYIGSQANIQNIAFKDIRLNIRLDNAYTAPELFVGTVAGKIDGGAKLTNVSLVDTENENYASFSSLKNFAAMEFIHGITVNNSGNIHTEQLSVYVGGFAGAIDTLTSEFVMNGSSFTINVRDDQTKHIYYVGGIFGSLNGSVTSQKTTDSVLQTYTIIKTNNTNSSSAYGGVAGTFSGKIHDMDVTTYIYAMDGVNLGGVVGKMTGGSIYDVSSIPMIYGAGESSRIGGVAGSVNGNRDMSILRVKVKFSDRRCENAMFNSSLTGSNFVGGIVGSAVHTSSRQIVNGIQVTVPSVLTIKESSVFSYITQRDNGFLGDIVILKNGKTHYVGGFIGGHDNISVQDYSSTLVVESCYLNADIHTFDGARIGGVIGSLFVDDYRFKDVTLTGNIYYVGKYLDATSEDTNSAVGNFIGKIEGSSLTKYLDQNTLISYYSKLTESDFNIIDSYSIMKAVDTSVEGAELQYIENFAGEGETQYYNADRVSTEYARLYLLNGQVTGATIPTLVLSVLGGNPEEVGSTNASDSKITLTTVGSTTSFAIELPTWFSASVAQGFTSVEQKDSKTFAATSDAFASSSTDDSPYISITTYADTTFNRVRVLNSFYMGYKANVHFKDSDSHADVTEEYTFNEADFKKSISQVTKDDSDPVEVGEFNFNYFNNYGYNNFSQPIFTLNKEITDTDFLWKGNTIKFDDNSDPEKNIYKFSSKIDATESMYTGNAKNEKTYIFYGEDGGVLNVDENGDTISLSDFTKYQNRELLDGNAIALISSNKTKNNKPNLVVDIAPEKMTVEVKGNYSAGIEKPVAILELKSTEEDVNATNAYLISDILNIKVEPALASTEAYFTSSDDNVFVVTGDYIVLKGEGVAILRATSRLNQDCYAEVSIMSIGIDRDNMTWAIKDANSTKEYSDMDGENNLIINILANNGTTLTTVLNTRATLTFGVNYVIDLDSVTTQKNTTDQKVEFLKTLTIGGKRIDTEIIEQYKAGKTGLTYTITCSGLQHAVFNSVLGSVKVEQQIYFMYEIDGTTYQCFVSSSTGGQGKKLKLQFNEGVFGISGSNELSFVVINRENFFIALNCDSAEFELSLIATLNGAEQVINNFTEGDEIRLSGFGLGYLTIRLENITFEEGKKLKTFRFSAYVDDDGQQAVNSDLEYTLRFLPRLNSYIYTDAELSHEVTVSISQQQVESLNITHYTNMLDISYAGSEPDAESSAAYKYQSDTIIPGYTSLMQIDFYPSFGYFDYVEVSTPNNVTLSQVVEALHYEDKSADYSWYESYTEKVEAIAGGIRINNRFSIKDYDLTESLRYSYNGSLYVAISADTSLSDNSIQITIKGYRRGEAQTLFDHAVNLKVEARPDITVSVSDSEITFGGKVSLNINVQYATEAFTASLKAEGSDTELLGSLADVNYDVALGSYVLSVRDNGFVYSTYSDYMYKQLVLTLGISKVINGTRVTSTKSTSVRLVPYIVEGIVLNLNGASLDGRNYLVSYYQAYSVAINVECNYSQGYYNYLLSTDPSSSLAVQIAQLENLIAKNIATYGMLSQGVAGSRNTLLSNTVHEYNGEFALNFDPDKNSTIIRFISSSVSNFIWAELGLQYTAQGVEIMPLVYSPKYAFSYYVSVTVDTASADDHPEPITSVNDLLNMREGVSYILLKDLYLANWSPLEANFDVFDGNGYVLTILSFANIDSDGETTNVGIFKSIAEGSVVKNLTIEVMPYNGYNFSSEEYTEGTFAGNISSKISNTSNDDLNKMLDNGINVDVSKLENVNFGLLAGENLGLITNVKVVNDATSIRSARESALSKINDSLKVNINYGDKFDLAINKFASLSKSNRKVAVNTLVEGEVKSKNDYIGGLVGQNSGFITNSSVSNISLASQEYIGGLVGYNQASAKISSSFFKESNITHTGVVRANSGAGGLVARNAGLISYSYVEGVPTNTSDTTNYPEANNLRAQGSQISTYSYAGGFAYENNGTISNCYANILLVGSSAGFVYLNETETSVVEYCYSLSSIRRKDDNYYPFTRKSKNGLDTVKDCFYLYDVQFANMDRDAGVSLEKDNFKDYNAFVGYAFNSDYTINASVLNAVWYIPNGDNSHLNASEFNISSKPAPQLVDANVVTLSVRYMIQGKTDEYAFTYNYATPLGTVTNPILIDSAEAYNKSIQDQSETRYYRFISDISFTRGDEVGTTINTNFKGKLDGNSMTIKNLRLSSDGINTNDNVTRLGLFATIQGKTVNGVRDYAVVKNLNIEVAQINGINVNMVGVLAGEVKDASIYNVSVKGADGVVVQGLNAVGGIAGVVSGDTDLVNLSSSISVTSNYFNNLNPFDYTMPTTFKADGASDGNFDNYVNKTTLYDYSKDNIKNVSYAGGIAGICNIMKRNPDEVEDDDLSNLYANLYRARRLYLSGTPEITGEVVGGIFGFLSENSNMSDCDITVSSGMHLKSTRVAGGLVGHSLGEIKRCIIQNSNQDALDNIIKSSYSKYDNAKTDIDHGVEDLFGGMDVEYRAMFVGGLVGVLQEGTILNSYSRVTVASRNSLYAGGLVGLALRGTHLSSVYTTGSVMSFSAFGGIFGYVTDKAGGNNGSFFSSEINGGEAVIELTNVVGANIWKYSHLDVTRKSVLSPNQLDANLGSLAGRIDIKATTLKATDFFFNSTRLYDHAKNENVYFKQTYTYKSLDATQKEAIYEIGNINPNKLKIFESATADKSTDKVTNNGLTKDINTIYVENAETSHPYNSNGTPNTSKKIYNYVAGASGAMFMSALFRYETNVSEIKDDQVTDQNAEANNIYMVSRVGSFGSLRSLEEIVKRQNSISIADKFYKEIGATSNVETTLSNVAKESLFKFQVDDGTSKLLKIQKVCTIPMYMTTWDEKIWKGINVNVELNTLEDPDQVFPALKNSLDTWTSVYVYKAEDLNLLDTRPTSTFILMNDIYLKANTGSFCSAKPFKGTIRSAKIGDVDGNNEVSHNFTFTIFNLNTTLSVTSTEDATAAGGLICSAYGATFENFNLHVIRLEMKAENSSNNKTVAMGVLVGRAISNVTIQNVQILGGKEITAPSGSIDRTSWINGGLNNVSFTEDYVKYARATNGYKDENGISLLQNQANVVANNVDFMGGYVGVASSYKYTGGNGTKQNEASVIFTDEDYEGMEDVFKPVIGLEKRSDGYYPVTASADITNNYVGKTYVRNIKFVNNYTGTSYKDGADQKQLSVVSYMGGYFGLATINGDNDTNFRVADCSFTYNLKITNNDVDKFVYDPQYVASGIYVGVIAGQIKNNGNETLTVRETDITNNNLTINTGRGSDELYDTSLNALRVDMASIYAGTIANLDQNIRFQNVDIFELDIKHNNGFNDGTKYYKGIYATTVSTNRSTINERIGGFAGNITSAVEFGRKSPEGQSPIEFKMDDIKIVLNGAEKGVKRSSLVLNVGGIAGYSTKTFPVGTVSNVDISVDWNALTEEYVGGGVGYMDNCIMQNGMNVSGKIQVSSEEKATDNYPPIYYVGGYVGQLNSCKGLQNMMVDVDITTNFYGQSITRIGGLVGVTWDRDGEIKTSTVAGNIYVNRTKDSTGTSLYCGGIAGYSSCKITDTKYIGAIKYYTTNGSASTQKTIFSDSNISNNAGITTYPNSNDSGNMFNGAIVTKTNDKSRNDLRTSEEILNAILNDNKATAFVSGSIFKPISISQVIQDAIKETEWRREREEEKAKADAGYVKKEIKTLDVFKELLTNGTYKAIYFDMNISETIEAGNFTVTGDITYKDLVIYGRNNIVGIGNVTFDNCVVMDAIIGEKKTADVKYVYLKDTLIVDSSMLGHIVSFEDGESSQVFGCEMLNVVSSSQKDASIYYSTITGLKYTYDDEENITGFTDIKDLFSQMSTNSLIYNCALPNNEISNIKKMGCYIVKSVLVGYQWDDDSQKVIDSKTYTICESLWGTTYQNTSVIDSSQDAVGVRLAKLGYTNVTASAYTSIDNNLRPVGVLRDHWYDLDVGAEYSWAKHTTKAPIVDGQYRVYNAEQLAWVVNEINNAFADNYSANYSKTFDVKIDARPDAWRKVVIENGETIYTYRYQDVVGKWQEYVVNITTGEVVSATSYDSDPGHGVGYVYCEGIDLSGKLFTPIKIFQGSFDGGGVPLVGINIYTLDSAGLFGELTYKADTIKNIYMKDGYIYGGSYAGAVAGKVSGSAAADDTTEVDRKLYSTATTVKFYKAKVKISKIAIENMSLSALNSNGAAGAMIGALQTIRSAATVSDTKNIVFETMPSDIYATVNMYNRYGELYNNSVNVNCVLVGCGYGATPMYDTTGSSSGRLNGYSNTFKNVYMAEINFATKQIAANNCYLANYEDLRYAPAGEKSLTSKLPTHSIKSDNLTEYHGNKAIAKMPSFRFNDVDWKTVISSSSTYNLFNNFGLPRIIFDTQYWCDFTDAMDKNNSEDYDSDTNTYLVKTPEELAWIALQTNTSNSPIAYANVKLVNDIDLKGKVWIPITRNNSYSSLSSFDGDGKTISNMISFGYYDTRENGHRYNSNHAGLFGYAITTKISNFTIQDAHVEGSLYAAFVVGWAVRADIQNITIKNSSITDISGDNDIYMGSIVGRAQMSTLFNCRTYYEKGKSVVTLSVERSSTAYVGGLIGSAVNQVKILGCGFNGYINAKNAEGSVGGLVGSITLYVLDNLLQNNALSIYTFNVNSNVSTGVIVGTISTIASGRAKAYTLETVINVDTESALWDKTNNVFNKYLVGNQEYLTSSRLAIENLIVNAGTSYNDSKVNDYLTFGSETSNPETAGSQTGVVKGYLWGMNGFGKSDVWAQESSNWGDLGGYYSWRMDTSTSMTDFLTGEEYKTPGNNIFLPCGWTCTEIGKSTSEVTITNAAEHSRIAKYVAFRASSNRTFSIVYDVDEENKGFTLALKLSPIGRNSRYYYGADSIGFNNVPSVTVTSKGGVIMPEFGTLFGYVKGVKIDGLNVNYETESSTYVSRYGGGIVNCADNCIITNCTVGIGANLTINGGRKTGGILGSGTNTSITNCEIMAAEGAVFKASADTEMYFGGVAGELIQNAANVRYNSVEKCKVSNLTLEIGTCDDKKPYIGGIVGYYNGTQNTHNTRVLKNSITNVTINQNNADYSDKVGGIVGVSMYTVIAANTVDKSSIIKGAETVGGIVGLANGQYVGFNTITYTDPNKNYYNLSSIELTDGETKITGETSGNIMLGCVENIVAYGGLISSSASVGGIAGYTANVLGVCYNTFGSAGTTSYVKGIRNAGGIVGRFTTEKMSSFTIANNVNYSTINKIDEDDTTDEHARNEFLRYEGAINVGGIVGSIYAEDVTNATDAKEVSRKVTNNYNSGNVNGYTYVGGLVGYSDLNCITYSANHIYDCKITGERRVAGLVGWTSGSGLFQPSACATNFSDNEFGFYNNTRKPIYIFGNYTDGPYVITSAARSRYISVGTGNNNNLNTVYLYTPTVYGTDSSTNIYTKWSSLSGDYVKRYGYMGIYTADDGSGFGVNNNYIWYQYPGGDQRVAKPMMYDGKMVLFTYETVDGSGSLNGAYHICDFVDGKMTTYAGATKTIVSVKKSKEGLVTALPSLKPLNSPGLWIEYYDLTKTYGTFGNSDAILFKPDGSAILYRSNNNSLFRISSWAVGQGTASVIGLSGQVYTKEIDFSISNDKLTYSYDGYTSNPLTLNSGFSYASDRTFNTIYSDDANDYTSFTVFNGGESIRHHNVNYKLACSFDNRNQEYNNLPRRFYYVYEDGVLDPLASERKYLRVFMDERTEDNIVLFKPGSVTWGTTWCFTSTTVLEMMERYTKNLQYGTTYISDFKGNTCVMNGATYNISFSRQGSFRGSEGYQIWYNAYKLTNAANPSLTPLYIFNYGGWKDWYVNKNGMTNNSIYFTTKDSLTWTGKT